METIEQCIPLLAAARELNQAHARWGIGPTLNLYGIDARLRAVKWEAKFMGTLSCQDARRHDSWTKVGLPGGSQLVDVTLERGKTAGRTMIVFVCYHPSFDPVAFGDPVPQQRVEFVDVGAIPKVLSFLENVDPDPDPA